MYRGYNTLIIFSCSILIVFSQLLATVLYSADFYNAWLFTPFLLVGVVFGSLVAYYSPFYLAHKKTKILFFSTFAGAAITIVFNIILIPRIGIMGAAITSVLSNLMIYMWLHIDSKKYMEYNYNSLRYYLSYFILVSQAIIVSLFGKNPVGLLSVVCLLILSCINYTDIKFFVVMIKSFYLSKKQKNKRY